MDNPLSRLISSGPADSKGIFRALSDPTRQRLLQLLVLEELNVSEMVEVLGQPQSTISRHLRVLRKAGLVRDRRLGTSSLYAAIRPTAADAENTDSDDLQDLIMNWLESRPIPSVVRERLERVLKHREPEAAGFFNRLGKRWDDLRNEAFGQTFSLESFAALLPRKWTVVDIGAGTGDILPVLSTTFEKVIAIEPAEEMLACARQRVIEHSLANVDLKQGSLARLPLEDGVCELAIAILVIHHVREPERALSEMHRILKPGGRVLIVEQEEHENQAFYERMQDLWWGFHPADLSGQLTSAGFANVHFQRLTTAASTTGAVESPPLFVMTGDRPPQ